MKSLDALGLIELFPLQTVTYLFSSGTTIIVDPDEPASLEACGTVTGTGTSAAGDTAGAEALGEPSAVSFFPQAVKAKTESIAAISDEYFILLL